MDAAQAKSMTAMESGSASNKAVGSVDASAVQRLKKELQRTSVKEAEAQAARDAEEKRLKSVVVQSGDIDLIMKEFDLTKDIATNVLRRCDGNINAAVKALVG